MLELLGHQNTDLFIYRLQYKSITKFDRMDVYHIREEIIYLFIQFQTITFKTKMSISY